ncbi:MAG: hypothetical protein L3J98_11250 [Gammaproteobacteria bacterium]|nr:hypothetical protein [Gammaproteobacteria bacterium]
MQGDNVSRFWDKYIIELTSCNVPEKARRWYVKRVEDYINAHPGIPLKQHTKENLTKYLDDLGRNKYLEDWQFKQAVDALRILFIAMIHLPWANLFPWNNYVIAATELPVTHATIARDSPSPAEKITSSGQLTSSSVEASLLDCVY